jgi:hypothetical protein
LWSLQVEEKKKEEQSALVSRLEQEFTSWRHFRLKIPEKSKKNYREAGSAGQQAWAGIYFVTSFRRKIPEKSKEKFSAYGYVCMSADGSWTAREMVVWTFVA